MRRAEVYWSELGSIGARPAVLLSRDGSYQARGRATVALVTSRVRGIPVEVVLGEAAGVRDGLVVKTDEIYTVRVDQLRERLGELDARQLARLDGALHFALGLSK